MRINADFGQRAIVARSDELWVSSPAAGVDRLMLDRIGEEKARATSIVRYASGSSFARHMHPQGEEFLVLEGVFSDEHRDYPGGSYVRNPPGTGHSPHSEPGCRLLVKLRQFDAGDLTPIVIDTGDGQGWQSDHDVSGDRRPLYRYGSEKVTMRRARAGSRLSLTAGQGGLEWLVVSGAVQFEGTDYPAESWFRFPDGDAIVMNVLEECVIWEKSGHLP